MTREAYHKALKELENELLTLGEMVAKAVKDSIEALKKRDFEMSKEIVKNDLLINKKRFEIEEKCLQLIATQQTMAIVLKSIAIGCWVAISCRHFSSISNLFLFIKRSFFTISLDISKSLFFNASIESFTAFATISPSVSSSFSSSFNAL